MSFSYKYVNRYFAIGISSYWDIRYTSLTHYPTDTWYGYQLELGYIWFQLCPKGRSK